MMKKMCVSLVAGLYLKGSNYLNNQQPAKCFVIMKYHISKLTVKSFSYQARKPVKRETIMTRIYTCHQDFEPIKMTSEN